MQNAKTNKKLLLLLVVPLLALSLQATSASAVPPLQIIFAGQVSSTLFPKEQVSMSLHPDFVTVLGVDVYHVTSPPVAFDLLLVYAWVYQPPNLFVGQLVPLAIYVDSKEVYPTLYQVFQGLAPVVLVDDVKVKVKEKDDSITRVTSRMKTDDLLVVLNSRSLKQGFPGETAVLPTPTGYIIQIVVSPGQQTATLGYITGYKSVAGVGFNADFTLTITAPA